jgi:hypothetical protein
MRNRWFPARVADYVPFTQLKVLKARDVAMERDFTFGVRLNLEEVEEEAEDLLAPKKRHVRPIEIDVLSVCPCHAAATVFGTAADLLTQPERTIELLDAFIPPTIDFTRQRIEQEQEAKPRYGATGAADVLTAAAMGKQKTPVNAIYGSVSTADVVLTLRAGLAHNDEAARVILSEGDVTFLTGHEEGDATRVKKLGTFQAEIKVPGGGSVVRNIRVKAKAAEA